MCLSLRPGRVKSKGSSYLALVGTSTWFERPCMQIFPSTSEDNDSRRLSLPIPQKLAARPSMFVAISREFRLGRLARLTIEAKHCYTIKSFGRRSLYLQWGNLRLQWKVVSLLQQESVSVIAQRKCLSVIFLNVMICRTLLGEGPNYFGNLQGMSSRATAKLKRSLVPILFCKLQA